MQIQEKWFAETTPLNAAKASATIGSGADGVVTITADAVGDEGNDYTITAVAGTDGGNLAASCEGKDITVTLGMTTSQKASAEIGSGTDGTVTITAIAGGVGGNSYSVEVVTGSTLGVALNTGKLTVTLATAGSSANDIATAINEMEDTPFTAVASGTGETVITSAEAEADFLGGVDSTLDNTKNTAVLIAAAINTVDGVTATKSGTGATALSAVVTETEFEGGQYGTVSIVPETILHIGNDYYINLYPNSKYDAHWRKLTFITY